MHPNIYLVGFDILKSLIHFIVVIDIGSGCQSAVFTLNDDTTTSRAWDIKITQFACGDIDSGGPPGCLQYYKETYGIMQRFVRIL